MSDDENTLASEEAQGRRYISGNIIIGFFLITMVFVSSQIWTDVIKEVVKSALGVEHLQWWQLAPIALVLVIITIVLLVYVFKVPLAAVY